MKRSGINEENLNVEGAQASSKALHLMLPEKNLNPKPSYKLNPKRHFWFGLNGCKV